MKILAQTKGEFLLFDTATSQEIPHNRPAVVDRSHFFDARIAIGQIQVLHPELKDSATDEEFKKYLKESDGDIDLAVESFLSAFAVQPEPKNPPPPPQIPDPNPDPDPKPKRRKGE